MRIVLVVLFLLCAMFFISIALWVSQKMDAIGTVCTWLLFAVPIWMSVLSAAQSLNEYSDIPLPSKNSESAKHFQ